MMNLFYDRHARARSKQTFFVIGLSLMLLAEQVLFLSYRYYLLNLNQLADIRILKIQHRLKVIQWQRRAQQKHLLANALKVAANMRLMQQKQIISCLQELAKGLPMTCYLSMITVANKGIILDGMLIGANSIPLRHFLDHLKLSRHLVLKAVEVEITSSTNHKFHVVINLL